MHRLLSLICAVTLGVIALPASAIAWLVRGAMPFTPRADHLHMMPGTPRSILETRRLGLA